MNRDFSILEPLGPKSLNLPRRRKELKQICISNMKLLERIEKVRSDYAAKKLESDYKQTLKYSLNSSFSLRRKCEEIVRDLRAQRVTMV
jgi:hypothetical protein